MKTPIGQPESVNQTTDNTMAKGTNDKRTNNTMAKGKKDKRTNNTKAKGTNDKRTNNDIQTLHIKLKIESHEPYIYE